MNTHHQTETDAPLLPCPFCGGTDFYARGIDGMPYCGKCGAQSGRMDWNDRVDLQPAIAAPQPAPITPAQASDVTLSVLRPIWREHLGDWHGPKVETWTIPEANMVSFFNSALRAIAKETPHAG